MAYFRGTFICWRRRQCLSLAAAATAAGIVVGVYFLFCSFAFRCLACELFLFRNLRRCLLARSLLLLLHEPAHTHQVLYLAGIGFSLFYCFNKKLCGHTM